MMAFAVQPPRRVQPRCCVDTGYQYQRRCRPVI